MDHQRRWWILAVLCLNLLVVGIDSTILNVALPTLVRDLGATPSQLQWIIDSYVLVFAGLLLTSGKLGDRYGRKGVMTVGLVIFGVASLFASLSTSSTELILWRCVLGAGAALIMPATLSILVNVFTDPGERRKAITYWSLMNATAAFIGPVTGGLLLRQFWWGSVFLVNVPVVIVTLVAGHVLIPTSRDPDAGRFDLLGAALSSAALGALLWSIIEVPDKGWTDPSILVGFVAAVVFCVTFVAWEHRADDPMLDLDALRKPQLNGAAVALIIAFMAMTGTMFLTAQSLQLVKGYTPLAAALATSGPICLVNFLWMPHAPRMIERYTARRMIVSGISLISVATLVIAATSAHSSYLNLFFGFALMALAFSTFTPASTETIMTSMPAHKAGAASSINQMTRQLGQALGIAVVGSVAASGYRAGFDSDGVTGVAPGVVDAASESITGAIEAAQTLEGQARQLVIETAQNAFIHGMRIALALTAALAVLAAFYAAKVIPKESPSEDDAELGPLPSAHHDRMRQ